MTIECRSRTEAISLTPHVDNPHLLDGLLTARIERVRVEAPPAEEALEREEAAKGGRRGATRRARR